MAVSFQGTPVIHQVSDRIVRITGLSLVAGDSGEIALFGHADLGIRGYLLPEKFMPSSYKYFGSDVPLSDMLSVSLNPITAVATLVPIRVVKSGTKPSDFLFTFTNDGAVTSAQLEMYFRIHE